MARKSGCHPSHPDLRGHTACTLSNRKQYEIMAQKLIVLGLIIAVAVFAGYRMVSRPGGSPEQGPAEGAEEEIRDLEQKILSFNIDGRTAKGVKQWHLEGNTAEVIEDEIHFNDLVAVAYGDEVKIDLTSDKGIYRKEAGEVELIGNVRVVSDDGAVLTTDSARWSQNTKEISTDDNIRIEHSTMVATGKGGYANSDEKTAVLAKDVTVAIEPDTNVDCSGSLEVLYGVNQAIFHEDVHVTDRDGEMFSDKLTVNIDPETKKIAEVIAEGNVKLKRGRSYTMSEKAIYTETTKSAQLLGKPRVVIDPAELQEVVGGKTQEE